MAKPFNSAIRSILKSSWSDSLSTMSSKDMNVTTSLEELQTDEQRRVLDTVSKVRKCGLESVLSLPQIVVCGDQSSGKSSVLEALTEIPFPRNDNLCTRFATEISLRRELTDSLELKIIPDEKRPKPEQLKMKKFSESITDLNDLPRIMDKAMGVMGIADGHGAFAEDILSIEIQGPERPQLTLVGIPGIIQSSTRGVSDADVAMVAGITERYIKQHRTICLAVVSATNDAANQPILQQVRKFDPLGERTLGVITKPGLLPAGSGSESKFLELARNEDVISNLGWHVVKNRKFEEHDFSIDKRNLSEKIFFSTSNFKSLPNDNLGIEALRVKLSLLLFEHVKNELPRLQNDLEKILKSEQKELKLLGMTRSTVGQCRAFLGDISMEFHQLCRAAVNGNYEHDWFKSGKTRKTCMIGDPRMPLQRTRAIVQGANHDFAEELRRKGHKYQIVSTIATSPESSEQPRTVTREIALKWVKEMIQHSRGTELLGNFNANVIAQLFWEQLEPWEKISSTHVNKVSEMCKAPMSVLLDYVAPNNIKDKIWSLTVVPGLEKSRQAAFDELDKLLEDCKSFPINYDRYYTDTIFEKRQERVGNQLKKHAPQNSAVGFGSVVQNWRKSTSTADMEDLSCEEALDCLLAIYEVQLKTFVANVTTQVIERHIIRGLDRIFSPKYVFNLEDSQLENMASEPLLTKKRRASLGDRIKKLQEGREILRGVIGI